MPGFNAEGDVGQDRAVVRIGEVDLVEDDVAPEIGNPFCAWAIDDIGFGIDQVREAFEAGDAFGIAFDDRDDLVDGTKQNGDEQQEADELAVGHFAIHDERGPGEHDHQLHEALGHIGHRDRRRHDLVGLELGGAVALIVTFEQLALMALIGKGTYGTDPADRFLDALVEIADPAVKVLPGHGHGASVFEDQEGGDRDDEQGERGEL